MDYEEFCATALSVHQLEALDRWEQHAHCAYELFEKDGNRAIVIEELASDKCSSRFANVVTNSMAHGTTTVAPDMCASKISPIAPNFASVHVVGLHTERSETHADGITAAIAQPSFTYVH